MKVSVITVCYNSEKTIASTLDSIASQTHDNIEHVIVDGGSTDGTISIVKQKLRDGDVFVSEPDEGLYDAMNKGVDLATGDIVGVLNSDDFYESDDAVATVVEMFRRTPEADLVFGDVVFVSPDNLHKVIRLYRAAHFRPWKLRFGWMPPHPATFVRKTAYERVGKYRLDMRIAADYDMFVRWLLAAGLKWRYLDRVLVRMRAGGVSTSGIQSSIRLNREIVRACRGNGVYTNLLLVLSKIPFKLLELIRRPKP
ncbi:glycosyltransferase family 2 protein [Marinobacter nauticus]|uniref:Glycosyl transferase family 2 n=1 Tax=Marinobacter nauticus TaxID=2743 RepID=A0A368UV53_MARNT|nr:glycosyltransferase family 2 protein [Marinobacter nauticus]RBP69272.1 glycosyl transferase family 2 [Marinobacter nauticus]RCW30751.1 glycosyl transferase family 2 [Marinobacter nauticus]